MAFDWVGAGLTAVKVGSGLLGGDDAEEAAERAYEAQADLTRRQRDEEIRMAQVEARQQRGTARAAIGASNIQFSGSPEQYLGALDYQNMREIAFMQDAARKEQYAILQGARGAGDALRSQAYGDLIGFAAGELIRNSGSIASGIRGIFQPSPTDDQGIFDRTSAGREWWG